MALDTLDFWVGSVLIFVLAMIQAILYGWIFGIKKGEQEAHRGAHIRIPHFVQLMLKYVVPVYLLVIFVTFCIQKVPGYAAAVRQDSTAQLSMIFIAVLLGFILLLVHFAGRRWQAEGRFENSED